MRMTNSHRRVVLGPIAVSGTDWQAARLDLLGTSGVLVNATYRLHTGGTGGDLEVKVVCGPHDPDIISSAGIALIPDDDICYSESAITLAASATTATQSNIHSSVGDAAVYDRRGRSQAGYSEEDRFVMLVLKGDGTLDGDVYVSLSAKDASY